MARVPSRPLTGVCVSILLSGCQAQTTVTPETNLAFAAPGVVSSLTTSFAASSDPMTAFEPGKATLTEAARANLAAQAAWLTDHPEARVRLIGGADTGDSHLAAMRVHAVEASLLDAGIDRSRIRLTLSGQLQEREAEKTLANAVLTEVLEQRLRDSQIVAAAAPVPSPVAPTSAAPTPPAPTPAAPAPVAPPVTEEPVEEPIAPDKKPKRPNAGKGNGGEDADPGNSGANNNAGDD